jgi:hypothetical protein
MPMLAPATSTATPQIHSGRPARPTTVRRVDHDPGLFVQSDFTENGLPTILTKDCAAMVVDVDTSEGPWRRGTHRESERRRAKR